MGYLKLFHLLFLFIWIGALLTTTHMVACLVKEEGIVQQRVLKMWRRFYFLIDVPSMCLAVSMGILLLILKNVSLKQAWLHIKLTSVFFLVCCDITIGFLLTKCESKKSFSRSNALFFKILHILIVVLVMTVLLSIFVLKARWRLAI